MQWPALRPLSGAEAQLSNHLFALSRCFPWNKNGNNYRKNVCSVHKEKEFTFLQLCCLTKRVKDIIMAWYGCKLAKKSKVFEEVVNKVLTAHCLNQSS
jgi:hypothetical protein